MGWGGGGYTTEIIPNSSQMSHTEFFWALPPLKTHFFKLPLDFHNREAQTLQRSRTRPKESHDLPFFDPQSSPWKSKSSRVSCTTLFLFFFFLLFQVTQEKNNQFLKVSTMRSSSTSQKNVSKRLRRKVSPWNQQGQEGEWGRRGTLKAAGRGRSSHLPRE